MRDPQVKPLFGELLDPEHEHAAGLAGAWVLNEQTGLFSLDNGPFGLNADHLAFDAVNFPVWSAVPTGVALLYEGSAAYSEIPFDTVFDTTSALTLEAFYQPVVNFDPLIPIFGRGDVGATSGTYGLLHNAGAPPTFRLGATALNATTTPTDNVRPYHLVGTWDGATMRIYVDGLLENSVAKASFTASGTNTLRIATDAANSLFLNAFVVHTRLWIGRALSDDQVADLFGRLYAGWFSPPAARAPLFAGPPTVVTTQTVQAKANVYGKSTQTVQAKADIRGVTARTVQARASISHVQQQQVTARASIEVAENAWDGHVSHWSVSDSFGAMSREFTTESRLDTTFQVGNEVLIRAGYDANRVLLIDGIIDEAQQSSNPNDRFTACTGRDAGARELQNLKLTKTYKVVVPGDPAIDPKAGITTWSAHAIIRDAASLLGLSVGVLEFPDYRLYASYTAIGQTLLSIIQELAQPFNQFARLQYVTQVRNRVLSVLKVDWTSPRVAGYTVNRMQHTTQVRRQTLYLEQPRLNEIQKIIIRGAAWTTPKIDLGTTTRIEYNRNTVMAEVQTSLLGQVPVAGEPINKGANSPAYFTEVTTETTVRETVYGDKVLNREEQIVINDVLSSRVQERYWYYEPGQAFVNQFPPQPATEDVDTFLVQSASPSENALLYLVHTRREGFLDVSYKTDDGLGNVTTVSGTLFREVFRNLTQYNYDKVGNLACENNSTQTFDADLGKWGLTTHSSRTHSQTTGGSVRTTLTNFIFEDSKFKVASADTQHVGGTRPRLNEPASRQSVITHQAQSPQGEVDANGNPLDPGEGFYTWTFEHPYMGQDVCDALYQAALDEQAFQLQSHRWEEVEFESILNPNVFVGQSISIEVEDGVFRDFLVEQLTHRFTANSAHTTGNAKRLTQEELT